MDAWKMRWGVGQWAAYFDNHDLPVMRRSAFACAPLNAQVEVKANAHYVTQTAAGQGAARELCDLLLVASGKYAQLLAEYA